MDPDPYSTVLVAVMNNPRDWTIAREQHWYRMPLSKVPKRGVHAPILAFYQTKGFDAEKWSIRYFARALDWETLPRWRLLPAEPNHPRANELYYKVQLSELRALPHPIVSRDWRRITFIVTHWRRVLDAQEVSELLHGTIWEERLWKALRKLGRLSEEYDFDW